MGIFKKEQPKKSNLTLLIEESNKHKNIFQSTANGLTEVNEKLDKEYDKLQIEIEARQLQQESLLLVKNENAKIVEKIIAFS